MNLYEVSPIILYLFLSVLFSKWLCDCAVFCYISKCKALQVFRHLKCFSLYILCDCMTVVIKEVSQGRTAMIQMQGDGHLLDTFKVTS